MYTKLKESGKKHRIDELLMSKFSATLVDLNMFIYLGWVATNQSSNRFIEDVS